MFVCFSKGFGFRVFGVFRLSHSRQVGKTSQLGASSKAETVTGFRLYCFFFAHLFPPAFTVQSTRKAIHGLSCLFFRV